LDNIDVLYSLLDFDNNRLDVLAQDKLFTSALNLVSSSLQRVFLVGNYSNLTNLELLQFGQDVALQYFREEFLSSHIFQQQITDISLMCNDNDGIITLLKDYTANVYAYSLTFFKKLQHLSIHGSSITSYAGLSLCDLPLTTFSSSILTKLCINASTFDDCLYSLDGRLKQLNTFIVRIYDIDAPSVIVHNTVSLIDNLSAFQYIYSI
jgi:hypothetical protein